MQRQMEEKWPHTGAVLVGGGSSRMGRPKQDIVLSDGQTMLGRVVGTLAGVCEHVVLVGVNAAESTNLAGLDRPVRSVGDLRPGLGPLGGIEALLASGLDAEYLVCPCDVPMINARLLLKLIEPAQSCKLPSPSGRGVGGEGRSSMDRSPKVPELRLRSGDTHTAPLATIVHVEGRDEPECLPARISVEALAVVRELLDSGERAVWKLMERLEARVVNVPADLGGGLANINTPEDLAGLGAIEGT
ncbi:MAG: molybdenum cofactor guanylyltransferase [Phycisphaerales bacterium]|nr:molybdenum cofactor guanylyltransferase [Phycisphaerales bacterium]